MGVGNLGLRGQWSYGGSLCMKEAERGLGDQSKGKKNGGIPESLKSRFGWKIGMVTVNLCGRGTGGSL